MLRMLEMTFPGFKFPPDLPPIHAWYIGHTRGFQPLLSSSNILSHRKVPFQKIPLHGKILKKGPAVNYQADTNASIIEINTIAENIDRTDMSNVENKDDRLKEIRKLVHRADSRNFMMWQLEDYKEKHCQNHKLASRPWVKRKANGLSKLASSISNSKDLQPQNIIHELENKFEVWLMSKPVHISINLKVIEQHIGVILKSIRRKKTPEILLPPL
jgi:hypothetical protein